MLDIKFVRENPEAVKENIRKKFQNAKLPLVDEAIRPRRRDAAKAQISEAEAAQGRAQQALQGQRPALRAS